MKSDRSWGLRIQILLALLLLLTLSFFPLFFAVTRITGATLRGARESEARSIAQALAVRAEAARGANASLDDLLAHQAEAIPIEAASVYGDDGRLLASRGGEPIPLPRNASGDIVRSTSRSVEVIAVSGGTTVALRLWSIEAHLAIENVQRLFALYMGLFAMALLTFAYFALTRLLVRPIDGLVRSTERIASGSTIVDLPRTGPREIIRLASSITVMAKSLLSKEEAMRRKVEELTRTTKQLQDTETQLVGSEHMASIGRLAAGVAHEIGNPIAAILGMEELLLAGGLEKEEERDFLVRMKRETERVHTVLRDLLDYARSGKGGSDSERGSASVKSVTTDVLALVRPQKDFKAIVIEEDIEKDLVLALAPPRLTQVMLNLLLNAGAALREKGGGTIRIVSRRVEGEGKEPRGAIRIEDDGPGVPEKMRELIFDPFFTTKDVGEGTGLGLSVCRGIVHASGGSIRLDPGVKKGAAFEIELPLAAAERERPRTP